MHSRTLERGKVISGLDGRQEALMSDRLDAHRVIRNTCDEDEGARWASGDEQRGGPVEIASGPAPAVPRLG